MQYRLHRKIRNKVLPSFTSPLVLEFKLKFEDLYIDQRGYQWRLQEINDNLFVFKCNSIFCYETVKAFNYRGKILSGGLEEKVRYHCHEPVEREGFECIKCDDKEYNETIQDTNDAIMQEIKCVNYSDNKIRDDQDDECNETTKDNESSSSQLNIQEENVKTDEFDSAQNEDKMQSYVPDEWNEESTADSNENEAQQNTLNTMVICFDDLESLIKLKEELIKRHINLNSISMISSDMNQKNDQNPKYALEFKDEVNVYNYLCKIKIKY